MDKIELNTVFSKHLVTYFIKKWCKKRFGIEPVIDLQTLTASSDGDKAKINLALEAEVPTSIITKLLPKA